MLNNDYLYMYIPTLTSQDNTNKIYFADEKFGKLVYFQKTHTHIFRYTFTLYIAIKITKINQH